MSFFKTGDIKTAIFYDDDGNELSTEELKKLTQSENDADDEDIEDDDE